MAAHTQDVIMLFGDSITQQGWERSGFATKLAGRFIGGVYVDQSLKPHDLAAYVRKLDVLNRGVSGYQTDWAIPVFEQVIRKQRTAFALIRIFYRSWRNSTNNVMCPRYSC